MDFDICDLVKQFEKCRILVIGDVMLDRYTYGEVKRVSPEAPVPVLNYEKSISRLGAAGYVASNIASLGGNVHFITVVGNDKPGIEIKALIGDTPSLEPDVITESRRKTTIKHRFMEGNYQFLRLDQEDTFDIPHEIEEQIMNCIAGPYDAIVLSDYAKGVLPETLIQKVIKSAICPVIVDPKKPSFLPYRGATVVTPNMHEYSKMKHFDDALVDNILLTRGKDGMSLYTMGQAYHVPSLAKDVFDVTGAGDTVVALMALSLAAKIPMKSAVNLANIAASIAVSKSGTHILIPGDFVRR